MDINRFHNCDIVLLCGVYGSGKTSFAFKNFKFHDRVRISRSKIRKLIFEMTNFGDKWAAESFSEKDYFFTKHIERKLIEHYLHNNQKVLIINTFITKKSRKRFIDFAKSMKKSIGAIFLNRPIEDCIARNGSSDNNVPEQVVRTLFSKIDLPEKSEGFKELEIINYIEKRGE